MKDITPVYVQLEYYESLEAKKEILSSEMNILNLVKIIKRYKELRKEELKVKSNINKEIKELKVKLKDMQNSFPFLKIPQKIGNINVEEIKERKIKGKTEDDLERELKQIQDRLREISNHK